MSDCKNQAVITDLIRDPVIKNLGLVDYESTWQQMKTFTANRTPNTLDEVWLLEHPPVYTQGLAGKPEHLLNPTDIPVIKTDRGGQITYHGPGQLVAYLLFDLKRLGIGIKSFVNKTEQAIIDTLKEFNVIGERKDGAPGVYVNGKKIASIGLRVSRGCTYHGISFNIDMDLGPFSNINPCGMAGLEVVNLRDCVGIQDFQKTIVQILTSNLLGKLKS